MMAKIFPPMLYRYVLVYLDDVLVFSNSPHTYEPSSSAYRTRGSGPSGPSVNSSSPRLAS